MTIWIKHGKCSQYFHSMVSRHRKCTNVEELEINGHVVKQSKEWRKEVKSYFKELYFDEFSLWPTLDSLEFNTL